MIYETLSGDGVLKRTALIFFFLTLILSLVGIGSVSSTDTDTRVLQEDSFIDPGLIFWNKLGSDQEAQNSEIGPNGTVFGVHSYNPVQFGNGFTPNEGWANARIEYPGGFINPEAGTVEFWAEFYDYPQPFSHGVYGFIGVIYAGSIEKDVPINFFWHNPNALAGRLIFGGFGTNHYDFNIDYFDPPLDTPVHLAMTWNRTASEQVKIYVDGVKQTLTYDEPRVWLTDNSDPLYVGPAWDYSYSTNRYAMDNLKIYDYEKTDFSDRFSEGTGLSELVDSLPDEILSDEVKNSLVSKVDKAQKMADEDVINAAINQLNAFINEVEAQRGKKISEEATDMLIEYARNIIAQLQ